MADYVSALNGQQMDAALTEVALYNPEAWAVGQRNGVPVTSADETYHNNAKYYAQVAQSAIPGTYTAAVRWDIAQGLAGEAQEQARANISAGASNRNLLDNPRFTVNQRGVSGTLTGNYGYCFDRWKFAGGGSNSSMTIGNDGRTITLNGTSQYAQLSQNLEPILCNSLMRRTVTLSCLFSDGNIFAATFTPTSEAQYTKYMANNRSYLCLDLRTSQRCAFVLINGESRTIKAMKLELGSYSTLANDVPPDYGEELRKCQRYFLRIGSTIYFPYGSGIAHNATNIRVLIPTPVQMRTDPSVSFNGTLTARGNGASLSVSALSAAYVQKNGVALSATTTGATTYQSYSLVPTASGYIDFSADI